MPSSFAERPSRRSVRGVSGLVVAFDAEDEGSGCSVSTVGTTKSFGRQDLYEPNVPIFEDPTFQLPVLLLLVLDPLLFLLRLLLLHMMMLLWMLRLHLRLFLLIMPHIVLPLPHKLLARRCQVLRHPGIFPEFRDEVPKVGFLLSEIVLGLRENEIQE